MTKVKKEKRSAVLYVKVKPSIKRFLKNNYQKRGYSTLSEFTDAVLEKALAAEKGGE